MAKKKKAASSKTVVRGFATTSVPKKVTPVEDIVPTELQDLEAAPTAEDKEISQPVAEADAEQERLQSLVDKLQEKTEKEVVRTIQAIEVDRRYSKTLPSLDLHPILVDRILNLAVESRILDSRRAVDTSIDKFLTKLGITYGVLRRLGFSEERVLQCLKEITTADIDDACDWLYTHCTEDEIYKISFSPEAPTPPQGSKGRNTLKKTKDFSSLPAGRDGADLNVNAAEFVPGRPSAEVKVNEQEIAGSEDADSGSSDEDDPNAAYVKLMLRLNDSSIHPSAVNGLKKRMEIVKRHYFFDEKTATANYNSERQKMISENLKARLRGDVVQKPLPAPKAVLPPPAPLSMPQSDAPPPTPDFFDDDSETGLFDLLQEMPTSETTAEGVTYTIRDMSLPKHWSGRIPMTSLAEVVSKADRYAVISYSIVSGASRAARAAVTIRWNGGSLRTWSMDTVACYDPIQAKHYVATMALHSVIYPGVEGFATGSPGGFGAQTQFRLLPPVFRNLWDELEAERKQKEDSVNKAIWAKLEVITEQTVTGYKKTSSKTPKPILDNGDSAKPAPFRDTNPALRDQLVSSFQQRQASDSYQEMMVQRNQLPIAKYRKDIIEALDRSQVLVLSGETGCGKSTQVPAFILEDQLSQGIPCKIYCTEPRRISAISLAQRVSRELGDAPNTAGTLNSLVGYSIRLESNMTKNTRLAYVTNGIALRMLESGTGQGGQGTAFDEITHIIIDEVHERTIESDFLLIVLKTMIQVRPSLRVILMSATVDSAKISRYFNNCPTLEVPGRTFPVRVNYLEDAVDLTQWTITEKSPYARRPHDTFYSGKNRPDWSLDISPDDSEDDDAQRAKEGVKLGKKYSPSTISTIKLFDERLIPYDLIIRVMEDICFGETYNAFSSAILIFMPGIGEIRRLNDMLGDHAAFSQEKQFRVYPLHSTLSNENQGAVFDIPPPGVRKIVIATNIAETGITIPDITCVIDTGKYREMRFDEKRQTSRLVETFVAKSNAAQRRGRAGRVREGICFHLFTKFKHDTQMIDNPLPEMMRLSLLDLALRIKIMRVHLGSSIEDVLSRALDPPLSINIQRAVTMLVEVGALTSAEEITPMGKLLSALPTNVHLGKFLLTAVLFRCLDPALTIAAALNAKSPFLSPMGQEQEAKRAKVSFKLDNSDFLTIHNAFSTWRNASANPDYIRKFCRENFLSQQNLQQIEELRQQFLGYLIDSSFISVPASFIRDLNRARYGRSQTRFVLVPPDLDVNSNNIALINAALAAGLYPKILKVSPNNEMRTLSNLQLAHFHPSSVNFGRRAIDLGSKYLAYFTLMHSRKLYAWETTPVESLALLLLCGDVEFKLLSDMVIIDRKTRFRVSPKTNIALKFLRSQLADVLGSQLRGKVLTESRILWNELGMVVLGKIPVDEEKEPSMTIK
ncbi:P-loop containing nucleoside triphosphate hydrolase protein [Mucidula mucida]|nr:P-loop containing nucleoside triphosphate hydrolase protein [Mucidula mucida]